MTTEKYYLKADHQTEWDEVTREQFINAEQAAGFRSKFGPNYPATAGFTGSGMRGRIEYVTEQPRPGTELGNDQHSTLIAQRERLIGVLRSLGSHGCWCVEYNGGPHEPECVAVCEVLTTIEQEGTPQR